MNEKLNIKLKNIYLNLEGNEIFRNFSLQFSSHGISVILGANGSGKTVLSKIIKGIINIDRGKVLIKKKDEIGYAPQQVVFLRRNVFENLAFPLRVKGNKEIQIKERVNFLLKNFDIIEKILRLVRPL